MLTASDRQALLPLIYQHAHGGLDADGEAELRRLVASDYPQDARTLDVDALVSLACGILGAELFSRALDAERARAAG